METHVEKVEVLDEGNEYSLLRPLMACCLYTFTFTF